MLLRIFGQAVETAAFANVHDDGGAFDLNGFADDRGELRQQFEGEIIDAMVSQILKGLERRRFARAGDPGDDDQLLRRLACRLRLAGCRFLLANRRPRFGRSAGGLLGRHRSQCYTGIRNQLKMA